MDVKQAIDSVKEAKDVLVKAITDYCKEHIGEDEYETIDMFINTKGVDFTALMWKDYEGEYVVAYTYYDEYGNAYDEFDRLQDTSTDVLIDIYNAIS